MKTRLKVSLITALCAMGIFSLHTPANGVQSVATPAATVMSKNHKMVYYDNFQNTTSINMLINGIKYPQWGSAVTANGMLCDKK
jgi:hypothetical protein